MSKSKSVLYARPSNAIRRPSDENAPRLAENCRVIAC
jgi:hypothetical protein